jgi:hypothetical protein
MASRLVPTILNFNHPVVLTRAESRSRPQSTPSGNARSFGAPDGLEPSEQNLNVILTVEDPGDDGEFKLPKMRSLVIMLFTNVLLQVGLLCSGDDHTLTHFTCLQDDVFRHRLLR